MSAIFVSSSSSTTDGLLWDNLSGSIAQGNRENPQDPNGRSCFFNVSLYKSTVLFLIELTMTADVVGKILSGGVDVADEPVSAVRENNRAAVVQSILPLSPPTFDFGKTSNMVNYFQTAALTSGQSAARPAQ